MATQKATRSNAPLPDGIAIGGYRIVRKIASGGFSIVYLAEDGQGTKYAIKEYMPDSLVRRTAGTFAPMIPQKNLAVFRNGLRCFFEEGRALARIFHPNVVRVVNFFSAFDTVYMVMAWERGRSLQDVVLRHRQRHGREVLPARHVLPVFDAVMNGLREVHANRLLHLDLKPANIYLRLDGTPLLLDFGAARRALDAEPQRLFPMYTPGFAAPEMYRRAQQLGPWTDIYGLGASMLGCLQGQPPQPADQRELDDRVPAAMASLADAYPRPLLDLVTWCLKLNPLERPQSVFALQRALRAIAPAGPGNAPASNVGQWLDPITEVAAQPD